MISLNCQYVKKYIIVHYNFFNRFKASFVRESYKCFMFTSVLYVELKKELFLELIFSAKKLRGRAFLFFKYLLFYHSFFLSFFSFSNIFLFSFLFWNIFLSFFSFFKFLSFYLSFLSSNIFLSFFSCFKYLSMFLSFVATKQMDTTGQSKHRTINRNKNEKRIKNEENFV